MQITISHKKAFRDFTFDIDEGNNGWGWSHEDSLGGVIDQGKHIFATQSEAIKDAFTYVEKQIEQEEQELADRLEAEMRGDWVSVEKTHYHNSVL